MKRENMGKVWLLAEIEQLKEEYNAGMHPFDIADVHGRTVGAIMGKLLMLGLVTSGRSGYHKVSADPWILYKQVSARERG